MMPTAPCFIGNSHVACIKDAVDHPQSLFKDKVTFFYSRSKSLEDTELNGRRLISASAQVISPPHIQIAQTEVDIDSHDLFAFFGLRLSMVSLCSRLYERCRLPGHPTDPQHSPISRSAMHAALEGLAADTLAIRLAKLVRQCTDKPIFVVPQPGPSETLRRVDLESLGPAVRERFERAKKSWVPIMNEEIGGVLYDIFVDALKSLGAKERLVFVDQPRETMTAGCCTKPEYQAHPKDLLHANRLYGLKVLQELEGCLRR
jgi:hypothetical protein